MRRRSSAVALLLASLAPSPASAVLDGVAAADVAAVGVLPGKREPSCTVSLIAPRVILTAAHCVHGPVSGVIIAPRFDGSEVLRPLLDVRVAPRFDMATLHDDVAVGLLADDAPYTPLQVRAITDADLGASLGVVGYGGETGAAPYVRTLGRAHLAARVGTRLSLSAERGRACHGDSGGPILRDGIVIGVVSSGDDACTGAFHATGFDDDLLAFVNDYVRETAAHAASAGQRCWDDAQCIVGRCIFPADARRRGVCAPPCGSGGSGCQAGFACEDAQTSLGERYTGCLPARPSPGGLGAACTTAWDCGDLLCARVTAASASRCLAPCAGVDLACPGASCVAVLPVGSSATAARACVTPEPPPAHEAKPRWGAGRITAIAGTALVLFASIFWAMRRRRPRGPRAG